MKCLLTLVAAALALNLATGAELKMRVDDELQLFVDGVEKANAFKEPGWQWTKVYTVPVNNNCVVAARMFNQGGPGEAIATLDGKDLSGAGWKCKGFNNGANPDEVFPGWTKRDFDDGDWSGIVLMPNSRKGPTAGMTNAKWWWGGSQAVKNVICRLKLGSELKMRVDDELQLFVDGVEKVNAFKEPGWQWTKVYTVPVSNNCVVAARMFNQGGPGEAIATLDGKDLSGAGWKCKGFNNGANPDEVFPGWTKCDFNDCDWHDNVLMPNSRKGNTAGMSNSAKWWWGGSQAVKNVICRLKLSQQLTIRVDDEVKVWGDSSVFIDTFKMPGFQWRDTFTAKLPLGAKVLTIKVYNQGGPGEILCNIDGVDCTQMRWKCNSINANQEPEQAYPGSFSANFNDASWDNLVMLPNSGKNGQGKTWWWGGQQSRKYAVCRVLLDAE